MFLKLENFLFKYNLSKIFKAIYLNFYVKKSKIFNVNKFFLKISMKIKYFEKYSMKIKYFEKYSMKIKYFEKYLRK